MGNYSLKYHAHVKKLVLLSPIGVRPIEKSENTSEESKFRTMLDDDHPSWQVELARLTWKNKISPFGINRFLGRRQSLDMFQGYVERKLRPGGAVKNEHVQGLVDYMLQISMRQGTTEYAPMINFTLTLQAHIALGEPEKLKNADFPLPITFIYGDNDWVQTLEEDIADQILS